MTKHLGLVAVADFNNDGNKDLAIAEVYAVANENIAILLALPPIRWVAPVV